MNHKHVL